MLRNPTLLLPAVAAQCVAGLRPHQAGALFSAPVVTIGGLPAAEVANAARFGPKTAANLEQYTPGLAMKSEVATSLAAAHAVILAEARGG